MKWKITVTYISSPTILLLNFFSWEREMILKTYIDNLLILGSLNKQNGENLKKQTVITTIPQQ